MRWKYDPDAGAAYLTLREGQVHRTVDTEHAHIAFDVTIDGELLGIEIISADLPGIMRVIGEGTGNGFGRLGTGRSGTAGFGR